MPEVSVSVNGRTYSLACADGEEQRLQALGGEIDQIVRALAGEHGAVGETRLLLMTCLLLADQLDDAQAELEALRGGAEPAAEGEEALATDLDALAQRIEDIAARL